MQTRVARWGGLVLVWCAVMAGSGIAQPGGRVSGRVLDERGRGIGEVKVTVEESGGKRVFEGQTDEEGRFQVERMESGKYVIRASGTGFARSEQTVELEEGREQEVVITLGLQQIAEEVMVFATSVSGFAEGIPRAPGSLQVLDRETLEGSRVFTINEALRKVPGIHVREEEGLGLRPNIGIRGTNPTRSTKILLLEDGIPLAYAPYGDNASYYHPPVERFETIEILKGSSQILFGPSTIGGVINYLTPNPPSKPSGTVTLMGGNRRLFNGSASVGGTWKQTGAILHVMRKQSEGARENTHSKLNDVTFKVQQTVTSRQVLTLRGNYYGENSNQTYSGLTEAEFQANPRGNPFRNDFFFINRWGGSGSHSYVFNSNVILTTNAYYSHFDRDWWRQSSNSSQRPNDASNPLCGGMQNLNTTCGNEGRLRTYDTWGIEPRLRANFRFAGMRHELDLGGRYHDEYQSRRQENGTSPMARSGRLVENNLRRNDAWSSFVQNRFQRGKVTVTPGVRVERIDFLRTNRLANNGLGVTGETNQTQIIPGIGVSYAPAESWLFFGGAHQGFAPPRTEDIINNTTGGSVDLDPELSWNYEAGVRGQWNRGIRAEATFFRMDYSNQVVPASLAGGIGATLTNGGETLHQGAEFSTHFETDRWLGSRHRFSGTIAYTWLPIAEFRGVRFSNISGFGQTLITGNRVPYAPEHLATFHVRYAHA
ncbi:MAG: TonB-dependent receptor domain-containing protein, partial [Blastocatellia bacterium]